MHSIEIMNGVRFIYGRALTRMFREGVTNTK
jgi:hypothetical protein